MIVLDTNVVSEPLKPAPDANVLRWLDQQSVETLYITAISVAELLVGVEMLPDGKRKIILAEAMSGALERLFGPRILPFDRSAAVEYARIYSRSKRTCPISRSDAQIAAIAAVQGYSVATRDTGPFRAAEVAVIDPWAF